MLKVIIADDEKFQREGLASYIPWNKFNMEIVGCAADGEDAFDMAKMHSPDILITDVKMPMLNGLELSEKVKSIFPNIKIIIISGYEEFEYARTAIELNAYAYILKPIDMNKMSQILADIALELQAEYQAAEDMQNMKNQLEESKPFLIERYFKDMIFGFLKDVELIRERAKFLSILLPQNGYFVVIVQVEDYAEVSEEKKQWFYYNFSQFILQEYNSSDTCFHMQSKDNEFVIVLSDEVLDGKTISVFIQRIEKNISEKFGVTVTLGISSYMQNISDIHKAYQEAEFAARQKFYLGKGKAILFTDINTIESVPLSFDEIYDELLGNMGIGNIDRVEENLESIFKMFTKTSMVQQQYVKAFCFRIMSDIYRILYEMNEKMENIFGEEDIIWDKIYRFDTIPDVWLWLRNVIMAVVQYIFSKRSRKNAHIIDLITKMIDEKYSEQITIDEIAKKVYLTPSYICNLFKENMKESIIDYLTSVRLKHAQRLLADSSLRIYEIAEKCGFNSTSYFSSVFKNTLGISPKDFRNSQYIEN